MSLQIASEPIAIVGSACRFPGSASSPSRLWKILRDPPDLLKEIPPSRFSSKGFYHVDGEHHGTSNIESSNLLDEDHRQFDNTFFNINPREAGQLRARSVPQTIPDESSSFGPAGLNNT